jgi:hypothetical protein
MKNYSIFLHFPKYHRKILLADSNAKLYVFQSTIGNESTSGYVMIKGLEK